MNKSREKKIGRPAAVTLVESSGLRLPGGRPKVVGNELQLHGHAVESSGMHSLTEIDSCSKQRVKRRQAAPGLPDCGKERS